MKKIKIVNKLNKSLIFKIFVVAVLFLAVEIVTGIVIYNTYAEHAYGVTISEYDRSISLVADEVNSRMGDNIADVATDSAALDEIAQILAENGSFNNYVVFTEASGGRILGDNWALKGNLQDYGLSYANSQKTVIDGVTYVFTSANIPSTPYYVGALVDFTAQQTEISSLLDNLVAYLIIAGVFILAAFIFYANWAGGRQRKGKFDYKIVVNSAGKIIRSNAKFKKDFRDLKEIKTDFRVLDIKSYNIIKLRSQTGEKPLVIKFKNKGDNCVVSASLVDNLSASAETGEVDGSDLTSTGKAKSSLSKAFEDFAGRGKRTLLGILSINNLSQIGALFGKETSLNIHKEVFKKITEKFIYAYELDLGRIGIAYPDGKNLDILISEMEDVLVYISQPIHIGDNLFTIDLKCGFALCDATMESLTFDYALKAAEAAYHRVLDTKLSNYIIFHESQKKLYAKYFITYNIKQMLSEGAFEMEYQPQYNIKEKRIEGFEALFRVKKSWNVNVDTFSFITYAERTGAMVQLGDFIFDTGMKFAKRLEGKNVSVSLNVSPVQLMQDGFTENFLKIYRKYDLKPGSICVEITESFLMTTFKETLKKLEILRSNGINIHLDDFGTEYSSLLYIKKLPISTIKIDKEFIKDVTKNKASQAVIKFITNIAKLLDLTTICEGVEFVEEFDLLNALGCDTIQGWLISKSLKPDEALKIVDSFDYDAVARAKKNSTS